MGHNQEIVFVTASVSLAGITISILTLLFGLETALILTAIVLIMAIAYRYPHWGLWAFLIYLPFGGTITYSLAGIYQTVGGYVTYTDNYPLFHLAKDAFYFPTLIALLLSSLSWVKLGTTAKPLLWAILPLLGSSLLTLVFVNGAQQLQTPAQGHPLLMGIIGLKVLLGYIPLMLCAYLLIRNRKDLWFLGRLQVVLLLICCSLCFLQYWLLINGVCAGSSELPEPANFKASLQAHCLVGGSLLYNPEQQLIRLPGTFVAPWQWAWFLISGSFFAYATYVGDPSRLWRLASCLAMAMILAAAIISGQRVALLLVPAIFLVLMLLTQTSRRRLVLKLGIVVIGAFWSVTHLDLIAQQLDSLVGRWTYSPPDQFVWEQLQWVIKNHSSLLGQGLGRTMSTARFLGDTELIETFYAQLLYEIGWLGAIAFLGVVSTLTAITFKAYRSLKNPSLRRLGLCLWLFVLFISYNTYYYPLLVDPVAVYYWFVVGVLLRLPHLAQVNPEFEQNNKN